MFDIFGILATPLGYAMQWLYNLVGNYGWAIIIFTLLVRVLSFPLSLKQQKSTARMQAYQPMIQEIQKKWASDKNRQNQEMQKFYEENNIKMSAGCAPMLVNMLVLFSVIAVIQAPLDHILRVDKTQSDIGYAIVQAHTRNSAIEKTGYTRQSSLIGAMKNEASRPWFTETVELPYVGEGETEAVYVFTNGQTAGEDGVIYDAKAKQVMDGDVPLKVTYKETLMDPKVVDDVVKFKFEFFYLNLADAPTLALDKWFTLILPVLSLLTMVLSQLIVMKTSGQQQGRNQMLLMTVLMGGLFAFYAFTVPAGFSLYYTISNIVMTVQQLVLKRIHDPEKIRAEVLAELEIKRAAKKSKKKVAVQQPDGEVLDHEVTEAELAKLRLAKAREQDAKRYAEEDGGDGKAGEAAEKAREQDEKTYGAAAKPVPKDKLETDDEDSETEEAETEDEE